jgi:hypothetical protein
MTISCPNHLKLKIRQPCKILHAPANMTKHPAMPEFLDPSNSGFKVVASRSVSVHDEPLACRTLKFTAFGSALDFKRKPAVEFKPYEAASHMVAG